MAKKLLNKCRPKDIIEDCKQAVAFMNCLRVSANKYGIDSNVKFTPVSINRENDILVLADNGKHVFKQCKNKYNRHIEVMYDIYVSSGAIQLEVLKPKLGMYKTRFLDI